jgi:glycosyltransferase involved in cell wall biosynthesis
MRVAHIITRLIVGGAQENTIASVLGLRQKPGLRVQLISGPTTGPEGSLESLVAAPAEDFQLVPSLVRPVHPWKDWLALRALTRLLKDSAPDIVHTHSGKAGVLGRLAAARAGVPIIIHTVHGPSFGPFQGALSNWVFQTAERRAARVTTHFVVVANAMTEQYLAAGIGRPDQYSRIFSGFDLQPFASAQNNLDLRARYGIAPEDIVVGKIARLFKLKGHDDLFAAAPELIRKCPRLKFLLVGDGPWRQKFESQAKALGLERHFIFTGLVRPDQVAPLVGIMDILVHLSLREGLPRALPQALAAGKPVIAYNCDGAREACMENQTGFLIAPGDLPTFNLRLLQLAADTQLRQRLGQAGQNFALQHFGVQHMVDELHALYQRLLA